MKAVMLVLIFLSPSGDFYTSQVGPFADERSCAVAAARLTEIARRNGIVTDGACIATVAP